MLPHSKPINPTTKPKAIASQPMIARCRMCAWKSKRFLTESMYENVDRATDALLNHLAEEHHHFEAPGPTTGIVEIHKLS